MPLSLRDEVTMKGTLLVNLWIMKLIIGYATPYFSMVVKYSEHLAIMQPCRHGFFGIGVLKSSMPPQP
jgi:hypothetical protein